MKNVIVLFGGKSVEHDVSIITGVMTANSLDKSKYNVIPILISQSGEWFSGEPLLDIDWCKSIDFNKLNKVTFLNGKNVLYAIKGKKLKEIAHIYVAINCMHGGDGEDGSIAGVMQTCGIPLASPGVLGSAISLNKRFTKAVLKGLGVKHLPYHSVNNVQQAECIKDQLEYPVIVKPNLLGSSIGIVKVDNSNKLGEAVALSLKYGECALIEKCLQDFIEINCAVYRNEHGEIVLSECEHPVGAQEVLSFIDKYENGKRVFPADICKKLSNKIKNITKKVYQECEFNGVIRIDYFIKGNEVYLNEINSVPGSLAYYLFVDTLKEFSVMLDSLIAVAISESCKKNNALNKYNSNILNSCGAKGAKRQTNKNS